jgi:hypothetical protein
MSVRNLRIPSNISNISGNSSCRAHKIYFITSKRMRNSSSLDPHCDRPEKSIKTAIKLMILTRVPSAKRSRSTTRRKCEKLFDVTHRACWCLVRLEQQIAFNFKSLKTSFITLPTNLPGAVVSNRKQLNSRSVSRAETKGEKKAPSHCLVAVLEQHLINF